MAPCGAQGSGPKGLVPMGPKGSGWRGRLPAYSVVMVLLWLTAAFAAAQVPAVPPAKDVAIPPARSPAGPAASGSFMLHYHPSTKRKKWERILRGMRVLDDGVKKLNQEFALPIAIMVEAKDCGTPNSFYEDG